LYSEKSAPRILPSGSVPEVNSIKNGGCQYERE
jgi:hypothetical protein